MGRVIINEGKKYEIAIEAVPSLDFGDFILEYEKRVRRLEKLKEIMDRRNTLYNAREDAATISGDYLSVLKINGLNGNPDLTRLILIRGLEIEMEKIRMEFEDLLNSPLD